MPIPKSKEAVRRRIEAITQELEQLELMSDETNYSSEREATLREELEELERTLDPDRAADRERSGRQPGN